MKIYNEHKITHHKFTKGNALRKNSCVGKTLNKKYKLHQRDMICCHNYAAQFIGYYSNLLGGFLKVEALRGTFIAKIHKNKYSE